MHSPNALMFICTLAVSFYMMVGATVSLIFKKVSFYNKFCRDLADQPSSVVV